MPGSISGSRKKGVGEVRVMRSSNFERYNPLESPKEELLPKPA